MTALITVAVLLGALTAVLLSALIRQQMKYRKLQKDIAYIRDRLSSLSVSSENGFLLLPIPTPKNWQPLSTDCSLDSIVTKRTSRGKKGR